MTVRLRHYTPCLLKEEGPAQVYRACGDAVAYLQQTPPTTETAERVERVETLPDGPLLLDMKKAAERLGMSTTFLYPLVVRGEIASVKLGPRRKIPYWALPASSCDSQTSKASTSAMAICPIGNDSQLEGQ